MFLISISLLRNGKLLLISNRTIAVRRERATIYIGQIFAKSSDRAVLSVESFKGLAVQSDVILTTTRGREWKLLSLKSAFIPRIFGARPRRRCCKYLLPAIFNIS